MNATVHRAPGASSFTIEVPATGSHMGRNGTAKIEKLEVMVFSNGTLSFNSINTKGCATNGGMFGVPVDAMLDLLEALKAEADKGLRPIPPNGNSEEAA